MKNKFLSLIFYFLFINSSYSAAFQNGSFESNSGAWVGDHCDAFGAGFCIDFLTASAGDQKLTGWTIEVLSGNNIDWSKYDWNIVPHQGTFMIELAGDPGRTRLSQVFDTVVSKTYQLTYYLWGRSSYGAAADADVKFRLCANNSTCTTSYTTPTTGIVTRPSATSWAKYSTTFVATTTSTYMSMENLTSTCCGSFLDNVSVLMLPELTFSKNIYVYDTGGLNLKAISGQEVIYDWGLKNTAGSPDSGTTIITLDVPLNTAFALNSVTFVDGEIPSTPTGNPATSQDTTPNNTTMTIGTVQYSSVGTSGPWTYIPSTNYTVGASNDDTNVKAIRVTPSGTMANGATTAVGFRLYYKAIIL